MASRKVSKYTDENKLKQAVVAVARAEWLSLVGVPWSAEAAEDFLDRDQPLHEREAVRAAQRLADGLSDAAKFHRDHKDKFPSYRGPREMTNSLLLFIELHLPVLVNCSTRAVDGKPALCSLLEPRANGWQIEMRGRVVVLMRDHLGYWSRFGLKSPATNRQMAYATILLGCFPQLPLRDLRSKGLTVADVLRKETAAVRASRSRVSAEDRRRRASAKG